MRQVLQIDGETMIDGFSTRVLVSADTLDDGPAIATNLTLFRTERVALIASLKRAFPQEFAEAVALADEGDRFASPDVPFGYDTIVGWVAKNRPEIIETMGTAAWLHSRDGLWLANQARKRGLKVHKVGAPPVLLDQGIEEVNAYPVELIAERFDE